MKIQVLGTGCPKCKTLMANAEAAVKAAGVEATVEKVTDYPAMAAAGVLSTPAVSVDGVVKLSGRVPTEDEVKGWLAG